MQRQPKRLTAVEYLVSEECSEVKHEYVDGEVYAMTGASRRHNLLAGSILARAWNAAASHGECQVFGSDMRVHVRARNSFYYPDVSGCCDPRDRDERYLVSPCFIVEVLSPSTAIVDRREKRLSYSTIESLLDYVIVDQDRMRVDVYRGDSRPWLWRVLSEPDDEFELSCVGLRTTLRELYDGVELPTDGVAEPYLPGYAVS